MVVIYTRDGDVLLLERASHPGYWQSVTGSQEANETLLETACREVAEETGIVLHPSQLNDWQHSIVYEIYPHWRHRYPPGVTENTEHTFSARIPRDTPILLAEHTRYCWLPIQQAAEKVFSPSNKEAILALPEHL